MKAPKKPEHRRVPTFLSETALCSCGKLAEDCEQLRGAESDPEAQAKPVPFTPGPWIAAQSLVVRDGYGVEIAVTSYKSHPQECEANAKLIAASPELLEALQAVDSMLSEPGKHNARSVLDKVRAAISKATQSA